MRFVQLISGAYVNTNVTAWDAHDSIDSNHRQHAKEVDKPITGEKLCGLARLLRGNAVAAP